MSAQPDRDEGEELDFTHAHIDFTTGDGARPLTAEDVAEAERRWQEEEAEDHQTSPAPAQKDQQSGAER